MEIEQQAKRVRIFVSGKVQGVGFREYTRCEASRLHLKGWTKNLPDGRVEILAEGNPNRMESFLAAVRCGPTWAEVSKCEISDENSAETLEGFAIVRSAA